MNIQSFIFVHDQNIILDCMNSNKFASLNNLKYVFVGSGSTTLIEDNPNVIICKNLPFNIEEYPKLTSYTGWYALWKNKLYDADYINLFEYDVELSVNFSNIFTEKFIEDNDVIGYIIYNVHNPSFLGHKEVSEDLVKSIHKNYNIDAYSYVSSFPPDSLCSLTSNHTFSKKAFKKYMEWTEPMIEDIKNSPVAGHQIERSIPLFYLLNDVKSILIPDVLSHYQLNSHNT